VAVFDVETITLTGTAPSAEAVAQLETLAIANSQFPDAKIVNQIEVNPAVPVNVGVRVIELNSPRFPEGSSTVGPEHGAQLNRVAVVMNALPNVTVMVVGHADQRGDAQQNYVLSEDRAVSVVRHLVDQGVAPSRLASRSVGEQDLLTLEETDTALALNRRTEFIFYGLLLT
jgi:outer membrane protein OmpA-like peptidoglycan-associated protein